MRLGDGPTARRQKERRQQPERAQPVATAPPAAASLTPLAIFVRDSVNAAPGQLLVAASGGNMAVAYVLPSPATMVGGWAFEITADVTGTVGAQTWTGELNVIRGGVTTATGIKAQITGTTLTVIPVRFSLQPGDKLIVLDSKSGALNVVGIEVTVWGRIESRQTGAMA